MANRFPADKKELRHFGLVVGSIITLLFGVGFPYILNRPFPIWPWVLGGVLISWGLIAPMSLNAVYQAWMKLGQLLNKIVSPIVLGIIFFGVFLPFGLVMRLFGRDSMARKFDPTLTSYRNQSSSISSIERPF